MNSFVVNHAAPPPHSRMRVPVWPSQRPRMPSVRITDIKTDRGPGRGRGVGLRVESNVAVAVGCGIETDVGAIIWTCILHFTSSTGVLIDE